MAASRWSLRRASAACALIALGATNARAQPPGGEPSSETPASEEQLEAEYQRHLDAGIKLHDAGQYESAIHEFEAALRAKPDPSPLVNMALCYERLDSPSQPHPTAVPQAIAQLRRVLDQFGPTLPRDRRAAVAAKIAELDPLVGQLTIVVEPAEARVLVGGVEQDPTVLRRALRVRSGSWPVRAELEGYASAQTTAHITSGTTSSVALKLEPTTGEITVTLRSPKAYVEIDGGKLQQGGWQGRLLPGTHEIRAFEPGKPARSLRIVVVAGKSQEVTESPTGRLVSDAPALGPVTPSPPPDPGAPPPAAKPAPDVPGYKGFYIGASSGILGAVHSNEVDGELELSPELLPVGVALGIRGGYRAIEWLGFEFTAEFGVTWGDGEATTWLPDPNDQHAQPVQTYHGEADYTLTSWRLLGGLRTIYPWDTSIRFVGVAVTGPVYSAIDWDHEQADSHLVAADGVDFALGLDVGVEFKIDSIVLDVVIQNILQTNRGLEPTHKGESAFDNSFIWFVGPAIRPGYEFF